MLEEGADGAVQVPKRLLQGNTGHLSQPHRAGLQFHLHQLRREFAIAEAPLALIIGVSALTQAPIVDKVRTAKRPRQHSGLRVGGVHAILGGAFLSHPTKDRLRRKHARGSTMGLSVHKQGAPDCVRRFIPIAQVRGSQRRFSDKQIIARLVIS